MGEKVGAKSCCCLEQAINSGATEAQNGDKGGGWARNSGNTIKGDNVGEGKSAQEMSCAGRDQPELQVPKSMRAHVSQDAQGNGCEIIPPQLPHASEGYNSVSENDSQMLNEGVRICILETQLNFPDGNKRIHIPRYACKNRIG